MTDQAFGEAWYQCGASMKRTFVLLIMANNLECRIAAIGKFNLSLPSFMTVKLNILYVPFMCRGININIPIILLSNYPTIF